MRATAYQSSGMWPAAPGLLGVNASVRPAHLMPVAIDGNLPAPDPSDDAFLSDLDVALERPRTRELLPFDALTPHVREVSGIIR